MGQYFIIVNLDKKEFLNPHTLGMGLNIGQLVRGLGLGVLPYLLARHGDDDLFVGYKHYGRWAGDRILFAGDYDPSGIYQDAMEKSLYEDITASVRKEHEDLFEELPPAYADPGHFDWVRRYHEARARRGA